MTIVRASALFVIVVAIFALSPQARSQAPAGSGTSASSSAQQPSSAQSSALPDSPKPQPGTTTEYRRPTEREKLHNYFFDAFGPLPALGAAFASGVQQAYGTPPEWGGGAQGYAKRLASDYGIAITTTSARDTAAALLREDTLYYPCACSGVGPRLKHALISTLTARRGDDGHRVFSIPALIAPFAGGEAATLGWYPSRYEPMDGARIGAYNLLYQAAGNVALEFVYGGPHTMLSRIHSTRVGKSTD
jgi:hypothetical protein